MYILVFSCLSFLCVLEVVVCEKAEFSGYVFCREVVRRFFLRVRFVSDIRMLGRVLF